MDEDTLKEAKRLGELGLTFEHRIIKELLEERKDLILKNDILFGQITRENEIIENMNECSCSCKCNKRAFNSMTCMDCKLGIHSINRG